MNQQPQIATLETVLAAVIHLTRCMGAHLTRDDMCNRLRVCRKTLQTRIKNGSVPKPSSGGKWPLADVLEAGL